MRPGFGLAAIVCTLIAGGAAAQDTTMSYFVTSVNPGDGADLGGLAGADAYCGTLAEAAGVTGKTWRAYLSTSTENARDRIGSGPWYNQKGEVVAESIDQLHSDANNLTKRTSVDENGAVINGRGDEPNRHDILTGSNADGIFSGASCEDWTSGDEGSATVGHHDRMGLDQSEAAMSWNSSHPSRGCDLEALRGTGGDGLFYCFAID
jgi:hypothetical protein